MSLAAIWLAGPTATAIQGLATEWDTIYLTCFVVGLALSALSFATGFLHLHIGHFHLGGHAAAKGGLKDSASAQAGHLLRVNSFTVVAFLCWFGGTGYLLTHGRVFPWVLCLLLALFSGLAGAGLVMWFVAQVMLPRERMLEPVDTPIIGVLGRVSATVPPAGVGEMLYSQGGARRSMPIAAEDGVAIGRGAEVVVLRFARGVAFVRRWDEMQQILLGDTPAAQNSGPEPDATSE